MDMALAQDLCRLAVDVSSTGNIGHFLKISY
jgi:hypothetical protein